VARGHCLFFAFRFSSGALGIVKGFLDELTFLPFLGDLTLLFKNRIDSGLECIT